KKFDDFRTAKMYYNEVCNTGILNLLKPVPCRDEIFIVIRGVNPGIYKKRYELLNKGLGWRGGYV
ncbi:hypothetical protein BDP27DRAFT_1191049, partial [Rhodocollybia butyracea]